MPIIRSSILAPMFFSLPLFLCLRNRVTTKTSSQPFLSNQTPFKAFPRSIKASVLIGIVTFCVLTRADFSRDMSSVPNEKKRTVSHTDLWRRGSAILTILWTTSLFWCYLYAQHILSCMHTQQCEVSSSGLSFLFIHSMFWLSPFTVHSAVLSGFRYSLGRAARLATGGTEATAAHPPHSLASIGYTLRHTELSGIPLLPGFHGFFSWEKGWGNPVMMCYG